METSGFLKILRIDKAGPRWNCIAILVLLESCLQTSMTYTSAECTVNIILMMGRGTARNM
jgi:hypothetical protein